MCASCARANPPTDDHGPGPWRGLLTSEIVSNLKVHALWRNARACALRSGRRTSVRCQHLLAARKCSRKLNWTAIPAGGPVRAPGLARCAKCRPSALSTDDRRGPGAAVIPVLYSVSTQVRHPPWRCSPSEEACVWQRPHGVRLELWNVGVMCEYCLSEHCRGSWHCWAALLPKCWLLFHSVAYWHACARGRTRPANCFQYSGML